MLLFWDILDSFIIRCILYGGLYENPEISVIMGMYNCADTLSEAIESILNQTMKEWELIMCDDGSSDATYEVAELYRKRYPEKMILLRNRENRGLNYTLNRCLKAAKGKYIARMDGDDICLPERFAAEYENIGNRENNFNRKHRYGIF